MVDFEYPQGATPLDRNEIEGLIPTHITTRGELDRCHADIVVGDDMHQHHTGKPVIDQAGGSRLVAGHFDTTGGRRG